MRASEWAFTLIIALQVGVVTLIVLEVYYFRHKRTVIKLAQLILRLFIGVLFLTLLTLIFGGMFTFEFKSLEGELWFWICCLLIGLLVLLLLLVDAHLLYKGRMRERERLYEDLARNILRSIVEKAQEEDRGTQNETDGGENKDEPLNNA